MCLAKLENNKPMRLFRTHKNKKINDKKNPARQPGF